MRTLLLDIDKWDIALDLSNNIAVASDPYAMAQDAASAIRLFLGELYWDTSQGIPYFEQVLGHTPPLNLMKEYMMRAALTVPGIVRAQVFITSWVDRTVRGQVQVWDSAGRFSAASF